MIADRAATEEGILNRILLWCMSDRGPDGSLAAAQAVMEVGQAALQELAR